MKKHLFLFSFVAVFMLGSACGGGGGEPAAGGSPAGGSPAAGGGACSPSGTSLQITAKNVSFDKDCLAAPADTAFTIEFTNSDGGTPHNVSVGDFHGKVVTGPTTTTYKVPAIGAGTYKFQCDVHPGQMSGEFVVS